MLSGTCSERIVTVVLALTLAMLSSLPACAATTTEKTSAPAATQPAMAGEPTGTAASQPAEPATQEARAAVAPAAPAAMKVLKAQEQAGAKYATVRADIEMTVLLPALGDSEQRTGWVAYQRGSQKEPEKIRVHFETLKLGSGPNTRQREDYAFDGQWAVEAKHSVKQLTRWQVAAEGERVQAMRIGKGAFPPLPFGQKADEVLEYYDVTLCPAAEGDPAACDHLELISHRDRRRELDFVHLNMWVSRDTGLPVKVVGTDKDKNIKTVVLKNTQTNVKFAADTFDLQPGFGWTVNTQPLSERAKHLEPQ
jgi:hypothetical protein